MHDCFSLRLKAALLCFAIGLHAYGSELYADESPTCPTFEANHAALNSPSAVVTSSQQMLEYVSNKSPKIRGFAHQNNGAQALVNQARLLPNPEIVSDMENVGGDLPGTSQSEMTVSITQLLQTGGKQRKRVTVAEIEREIVQIQTKNEMRQILKDAKLEFGRVQAAQSVLKIAAEQASIAKESLVRIRAAVNKGGSPQVELTRTRVAFQNAVLDCREAQQQLHTARRALALFWNGSEEDVGNLNGGLEATQVPECSQIDEVESYPSYIESALKVELAKRQLALEHANTYPDVTLGAGYRRIQESNDNTFIASFSIPLPIFNRNQGNIQNAHEQLAVQNLELQGVARELRTKSSDLYARLELLSQKVSAQQKSILPDVQLAFTQTRSALNLGKARYTDLLDTQQELSQAKRTEQEMLLEMLEVSLELQFLIGKP